MSLLALKMIKWLMTNLFKSQQQCLLRIINNSSLCRMRMILMSLLNLRGRIANCLKKIRLEIVSLLMHGSRMHRFRPNSCKSYKILIMAALMTMVNFQNYLKLITFHQMMLTTAMETTIWR